ncbi:tyrosine-type recombinase/integrase [Vreelandella titanicae]|nr:site-specific integrase [Halomonas titanicae]MCE7521303.1 site-specific integrase [Halomonas titanicae]|tara:strand:+ start:7946 stop:11230 length:3285 start_codon:yes stop_codon:yes gene_type:complete
MSEQSIWAGWKLTPPIQASTDGEASRRYQRAREKYKELSSALNQLEARVPGAMEGRLGLDFPERATSDAFESLHTITSPQKLRQQHNFLVKGLERGTRELDWRVSIPSPMVTLPRKSPPVTTDSFSQLHGWDTAVNKHDQLLPPTNLRQDELKKWLAGRFLFQLVREGALLNKEGLKQVPTAVVDGIAFEKNMAYLTLKKELQAGRSGSKKETNSAKACLDESPDNILEYEQHYQYRRLFLSPMSQLLLLNYYQQRGRSWPPSDSAEACLLYYAKRLSSELARVRLTALLSVAKTSASMEMPPLLTHYASHADASSSLRPSAWRRLVSRQVVSVTTDEVTEDEEDTHPAFTVFPARGRSYPDQLKRYRQLQACFAASSSRKTGKTKAIANINTFLATPEQNGVMMTLLAAWCKTLIRKGGRVKSTLTISTVATYLSIIARPLITHEHTIDELEIATTDEWEKLYETVLNDAKTSASRIRTQSRLRDFHHYLSNAYAVPPMAFEAAGQQQRRVDVNVITPAEYRRAIAMIESSKQTQRFKTMQQLALILGYRLGLRRNECASLLLHDIAYLPDRPEMSGDVIVRANKFHNGKSYSATRRLPLWLLMPEERALLTDWVQQRRGEVTTRSVEKQLLFCRSGDGNSLLEDNVLFRPIQIALKAVSGDKNLRYHHLRHSFVTFTLLRLLERRPDELLSSEWTTDDNGQIALPNVSVDISDLAGLPPLHRTSRKRLWQLALWAGHASPDETLSSYSHLLDWALGKTLNQQFDLALSIDQQLTLLNLPSKTALTSWRHRRGLKDPTLGSELLQHLQDQWHDFMADSLSKTAWKPYHAPSQNPLNIVLKTSSNFPEVTAIYQSLRLFEQLEHHGMSMGDAITQVTKRFVLDPVEFQSWIASGEYLMAQTTRRSNPKFSRNKNVKRGELIASQNIYMPELNSCMAPPIKPHVLREAGQFFHKLMDWCPQNIAIAEVGSTHLFHCMQRSTGHITLPDAESINAVLELLRPLRCVKHTYLIVETGEGAKDKPVKNYWSNATDIPHKRIELVPTSSSSGRTRYWYGNVNLKITRGHYSDRQQPLWEAFRFAVFMMMLVGGFRVFNV